MSDTLTRWEINVLTRDLAQLQEQVKNLEAELREIKKSLEKNREE